MASTEVDKWFLTAATFKERYPPEVVEMSPILAPSNEQSPDGSVLGMFLDKILTYLASIQVVVLDHLADAGDEQAIRRREHVCGQVRTPRLTAGAIEHRILRGANPLGDGVVAVGTTPVSSQEAPNAARVFFLWNRVSPSYDPLTTDWLAELERAGEPASSTPWAELLRSLIEMRNARLHPEHELHRAASSLPTRVWSIALQAAVELGVTGPAEAVLRRYTTGRRLAARQREDGRWVCGYLTPSSRRMLGDFTVGLTQDQTEGEVVLRFDDERSEDGSLERWVESLGPLRAPHEVCRDDWDVPIVTYNGSGQAWLSAGVGGISVADGRTYALHLPIDATVEVSVRAQSARGFEGLRIDGASKPIADVLRGSLEKLLPALNALGGAEDYGRSAPGGMEGAIEVVKLPDDRFRVLGIDAALVLAVCRPVARVLHGRLADGIQVSVSRDVLGNSWAAYRDSYGWCDIDRGDLVGAPFSCPAAEILMLIPTGPERRPRAVDVHRFDATTDDANPPTEFRALAESCGRATNAFQRSEPNPLVSILRPIARQFGATCGSREAIESIVSSPFSWAAGILFPPRDPACLAAKRWLEQQRMPRYIEPHLVSTAATTQPVAVD